MPQKAMTLIFEAIKLLFLFHSHKLFHHFLAAAQFLAPRKDAKTQRKKEDNKNNKYQGILGVDDLDGLDDPDALD